MTYDIVLLSSIDLRDDCVDLADLAFALAALAALLERCKHVHGA